MNMIFFCNYFLIEFICVNFFFFMVCFEKGDKFLLECMGVIVGDLFDVLFYR